MDGAIRFFYHVALLNSTTQRTICLQINLRHTTGLWWTHSPTKAAEHSQALSIVGTNRSAASSPCPMYEVGLCSMLHPSTGPPDARTYARNWGRRLPRLTARFALATA